MTSNALSLVRSYESRAKAAIPNIQRFQGSNGRFSGIENRQLSGNLYAELKNWVFVAVNAISTRIASQPVMSGEMLDATPNPMRDGVARTKMPSRLRNKAAMHEVNVIRNHPVLDFLQKPNPVQRKSEFIYMMAANILVTGESYLIGGSTKDGMEAWAVPTPWIIPQHKGGLFTGYIYRPPGFTQGIELDPDQVARTYMPDPGDLKCAMSPLMAMLGSARADANLQGSQEEMFSRGIHPNLMITVGRNRGADGKLTDRRPVLTGFHRRQLIKSVREIWGNTVNRGDPAIIDGLIESVHKLQSTPQEMDFLQSGETLKKRILQAYSVNPIILGEIGDANRATAIQAEKMFLSMAVNPLLDAISETLTDFIGPMYELPARLLVWLEEARALDPELELERWREARKNGDVTRNEWRTHILNLPPVPDNVERNLLLSGTGGMQATMLILMAVAKGELGADQATNMLMLFLEIDQEMAEELVGEGAIGMLDEEQIENQLALSEERTLSSVQSALASIHDEMHSRVSVLVGAATAEQKRIVDLSEVVADNAKTEIASMKSAIISRLEQLDSVAQMHGLADKLSEKVNGVEHKLTTLMSAPFGVSETHYKEILESTEEKMGEIVASARNSISSSLSSSEDKAEAISQSISELQAAIQESEDAMDARRHRPKEMVITHDDGTTSVIKTSGGDDCKIIVEHSDNSTSTIAVNIDAKEDI